MIATGLKAARLGSDDVPSLLVQRVGRLQFRHPEVVLPEYVLIWLNSAHFIDRLQPGRSTGVPHIASRDIEAMPFPLPPLAEQQRIVDTVARLTTRLDELKLKLDQAEALRCAWVTAL
ncbi:MAG: restriction endonuclease subunit S [Anaerolineales bacterium]|nr:restriction endonuclease subunit S [Anaerolineales bacterium]